MILGITLYPDPTLLVKSKDVTEAEKEAVVPFLADMFETMQANKGVGLAAIQVGVPLRIFVLDTSKYGGKARVCINPSFKVLPNTGIVTANEGCLSFPKEYVEVARFKEIEATYTNGGGELVTEILTGLDAVAFQHELEHLDGKTLADKVGPVKRKMIRDRMNKLYRNLKKGVVQVAPSAKKTSVSTETPSTNLSPTGAGLI